MAFVCTIIALIGFLVCHGTFQAVLLVVSQYHSSIIWGPSQPPYTGTICIACSLYSFLFRFLGAFPSPPTTGSFFLFLGFFTGTTGIAVIFLAGEIGGGAATSICPRLVRPALLVGLSSTLVSLSDNSSNGSKTFCFQPNGIAPVGMNRPLRRCSGWT